MLLSAFLEVGERDPTELHVVVTKKTDIAREIFKHLMTEVLDRVVLNRLFPVCVSSNYKTSTFHYVFNTYTRTDYHQSGTTSNSMAAITLPTLSLRCRRAGA